MSDLFAIEPVDVQKKLTPAEENDLLKKYRSLSNTRKHNVNEIRLVNSKLTPEGKENPDFGKLFAYTVNAAGEFDVKEIDTKVAQFFLAKVRVQIVGKEFDDKSGLPKFVCRETNEFEPIELTSTASGEVVFTGTYTEAKEKFPVRYQNIAYTVYEDKIYRWRISSAHFTSWFKLRKQLDKQVRPTTFKIAGMRMEKSGSVFFNVLEFAVGEQYPVAKAVKYIETLDEALTKYYSKIAEESVAQATEKKEEEVEVVDLPWDEEQKKITP
jgi:hypothetical protein